MKKVPSPSRIRAAEQDRRLWIALGISLGIHALLLTLHFQFPEASRAMQEKAMDIILVNAKSARKPHDAQALAQANLDGGGNVQLTDFLEDTLVGMLRACGVQTHFLAYGEDGGGFDKIADQNDPVPSVKTTSVQSGQFGCRRLLFGFCVSLGAGDASLSQF